MLKERFEQQKAAGGGVSWAWDRLFQRAVALKALPEGVSEHGNSAALAAAWERWYAAPHPGLLKPVLLDLEGKRLVREWAPGFSLLELLRRRGRLEGEEAAALLESAAGTLDHAGSHGLLAEAALDKWFAAFEEPGDGRPIPGLSEPLGRWPAWQLKLDPLRLAWLLAGGEERTRQLGAGVVEDPGVVPAVAAGLGFVRELLGASPQRTDAPLSALNDEGNQVLLAARDAGEFRSATELAEALLASLPARLPAGKPRLTRPVREYELIARGTPAAGEKLLLEPTLPRSRALQLVRRDELRLGRSATEADVALRFAERSNENEELTKALSRIHARLQRIGDDLRLLDGRASAASSNGTFTREGRLTDPAGLPLRQLMLLQLGTHWRATLAPAPAPESVRFREERTAPPESERPPEAAGWGAVFVLPAQDCRARVETVWLLEEAGFGLDTEEALVWDWEGVGTAPAAFRATEEGGFLLLNRRIEGVEFSIDLRPLKPGTACVLGEGMLLAAGRDAWRIRIA